jgi:hypothetical protein
MVDVKLNREVRASFINVSNEILLGGRGQEEFLKTSGLLSRKPAGMGDAHFSE